MAASIASPSQRSLVNGPLQTERSGLSKRVPGTGDKHTGATGLAPHSTVGRAGVRQAVISRKKLALVDPQFAVQEIPLLDAGVHVWRVFGTRGKTHQHAYRVPFIIGGENLAADP